MSNVDILERVFPMQKRSVLLAAFSACQGDLAKTIDHFITLGDNMVSIQHQLQSEVPPISHPSSNTSNGPHLNGKSAFTPLPPPPAHPTGPPFDFRPSMFFPPPPPPPLSAAAPNVVQRDTHLPLLAPPAPASLPNHPFAGLYPPPVNFLHHFAQTHPAALAAAYEKLLKRHQHETAAAAAAAILHKAGGDR